MAVFSTDLDGLDKAFSLARMQGEVAGLQFVQQLVNVLKAELDTQIQTALATEREELEHGNNAG